VWFYDPQRRTFLSDTFRCTARQFERYVVGDWIKLRLNTGIWAPFRHWVVDARVEPSYHQQM